MRLTLLSVWTLLCLLLLITTPCGRGDTNSFGVVASAFTSQPQQQRRPLQPRIVVVDRGGRGGGGGDAARWTAGGVSGGDYSSSALCKATLLSSSPQFWRGRSISSIMMSKKNDGEDDSKKEGKNGAVKINPVVLPFLILIGADLLLNIAVILKRTFDLVVLGQQPSTTPWW